MPFTLSSKTSQGVSLSREAIAAYERKEYDVAADKFVKSLDLNEDDCETRRYYAETLWQQGKKSESLAVLNDALEDADSDEDQGLIYRSLGQKYLDLGALDHANNCAGQLIDLEPQSSEGWRIRALCSSRTGKLQDALSDFQRALTYSPDSTDMLLELVNLQMQMERYDRALITWQYLARFYAAQNEPVDILYGKAYCMYRLRRLQESDEAVTVAIQRVPDRPEFYRLAVQVCIEKEEYERAAEVAYRAVALFPNDEPCRRSLDQINRRVVAQRDIDGHLN